MNGKEVGIGIIAAGLIYGAYKLYYATTKLQFSEVKITEKRASLTGFEIDMFFEITNNDDTSLQFDGFDGSLMYGKHKFSDIVISNKYLLKAKTKVATKILVSAKWLDIGIEIRDIIKKGDFLNGLFIEGNIKSTGLKFFVKEKVL